MNQNMRGRIGFLLLGVIVINLLIPVSEMGTPFTELYTAIYPIGLGGISLLVIQSRIQAFILMGVAGLIAMTNVLFIATPSLNLLTILSYVGLISFSLLLLYYLFQYIFRAHHITRDVLFAGIAAYILVADTFIPTYMLIELITQVTVGKGAFILALAPDIPITWQNLSFYSFVTLTTTGYGDMLAVTSVARMVTIIEALVGTLYLATFMARLVGLYATTPPNNNATRNE